LRLSHESSLYACESRDETEFNCKKAEFMTETILSRPRRDNFLKKDQNLIQVFDTKTMFSRTTALNPSHVLFLHLHNNDFNNTAHTRTEISQIVLMNSSTQEFTSYFQSLGTVYSDLQSHSYNSKGSEMVK
jgi:hypothetical protein